MLGKNVLVILNKINIITNARLALHVSDVEQEVVQVCFKRFFFSDDINVNDAGDLSIVKACGGNSFVGQTYLFCCCCGYCF